MNVVLWLILILVCFKMWHDDGFVVAILAFILGLLLINIFPFILCLIIAIYIVSKL